MMSRSAPTTPGPTGLELINELIALFPESATKSLLGVGGGALLLP
jgi:hypothetical protein